MVSHDLDGDGIDDLAVSSMFTGNISLYISNGAEIPSKPTMNLTALIGVRALGVGDFNGDGRLDIISSVDDYKLSWTIDSPNYMNIYYGPFTDGQKPDRGIFGGYEIRDLQVRDFNGDGSVSLATVSIRIINVKPVANFTVIVKGNEVIVDGSSSYTLHTTGHI